MPYWRIIDFEKRRALRVYDAKNEAVLTEEQVDAAIRIANRIWNPPRPRPDPHPKMSHGVIVVDPPTVHTCTDVWNEVILLDGDRTLEVSSSCPFSEERKWGDGVDVEEGRLDAWFDATFPAPIVRRL